MPKLDELTRQLEIVTENFDQIYKLAKNLKVKLLKPQEYKKARGQKQDESLSDEQEEKENKLD